jgi:hypothetical protein
LVPLSDEQRREAVGLLAQLLLDAAPKREGAGEAQKTKALLRLLIQELRVDGRAQIRPTYRLITPAVCATSEKVERTGIEPIRFASTAAA